MVEVSNQAPIEVILKIASSVECVSPLGEAIQALSLSATGNPACALAVQQAVIEAVNNVVLHAYKNQAVNDIIVKWRQEYGRLQIDIIDYGLAMTALPPPDLPDFEAEGGRGWWIIDACVDEYYYKAVKYVELEAMVRPNTATLNSENLVTELNTNILTLIKNY